jgi:hypothetical protein
MIRMNENTYPYNLSKKAIKDTEETLEGIITPEIKTALKAITFRFMEMESANGSDKLEEKLCKELFTPLFNNNTEYTLRDFTDQLWATINDFIEEEYLDSPTITMKKKSCSDNCTEKCGDCIRFSNRQTRTEE